MATYVSSAATYGFPLYDTAASSKAWCEDSGSWQDGTFLANEE